MRRNGLAVIASIALHGAAALALLTPWPAPPAESLPPLIIDVVPAPPAAALVATSAASTASVPPSPPAAKTARTRALPPPSPRPAPHKIAEQSQKPAPRTPSAAAESSPDTGTVPTSLPLPSNTQGDGTTPAADDSTASSPGYSLGAALTPLPEYPWSARRRGIEGRVVIRLDVGADGRPTQVDLIHSSGDDTLDQAAISTLRHWQLRPAMAGGMPVAGHIVVPIVFKLT